MPDDVTVVNRGGTVIERLVIEIKPKLWGADSRQLFDVRVTVDSGQEVASLAELWPDDLESNLDRLLWVAGQKIKEALASRLNVPN